MSDVFISYASEDRTRAEIMAKALEAEGWSVWWDRRIPAGRRFTDVIQEEVDKARCVVVLWSQVSIKKDWVFEEAAEGKRRQVLVPVLLDPVSPPLGFRLVQAADLSRWTGEPTDSTFRALCRDIADLLGALPAKTAATPPPARPLQLEPLNLPKGIYQNLRLSPDAATAYLSRFRERIDYTRKWDLVSYDMQTARVEVLGDVGSDTYWFDGFEGSVFYKTASIEDFQTHRILRFDGANRPSDLDRQLEVSCFRMVHGKPVFKIGSQWFMRHTNGQREELAFGGDCEDVEWSALRSTLALLKFPLRPAVDQKRPLWEYRLVLLDKHLMPEKLVWTYSDSETTKLGHVEEWTDTKVLFVEYTNHQASESGFQYTSQRNAAIKCLQLDSGRVSDVIPDRLNLRFLAGNASGVVLFADEVSVNSHTKLLATFGSKQRELLDLKTGHFRDFQIDPNWTTLLVRRVDDTTGRGDFFDTDDESQCLRVDLSAARLFDPVRI